MKIWHCIEHQKVGEERMDKKPPNLIILNSQVI